MGGQHSQKVAVKKPKAALDINPPKVAKPRKSRAKVTEPVNPLAGERRPRIKTKLKFKRWV